MPPPTLWQFRVSHYNEKVRWALDHKRWPHVRRSLLPGFHVPVARRLSGRNQLPVLAIDGRVLAGSGHILEALESLRPDPALFPADPAQRRRALEIQAHFDDEVAPDLRRLFWSAYIDDAASCARMAADGFSAAARCLWRLAFPAMRPLLRRNMGMQEAALAAARGRMPLHFAHLESLIGKSGYLAGDAFSVADLTAAAVMTAIVRPAGFPYPLPQPWPAKFAELRESVARRPGFQWVVEIYARHRGRSSALVER